MTSKRLLLLILLTVVVFVGLFSYGDFKDIGGQLSRFPLTYLLAALGLAVINYVLRFLRWSYYLRFSRRTGHVHHAGKGRGANQKLFAA